MERIYLVESKDENSKKGLFVVIDDEKNVLHELEAMDIFEDEYTCRSIKNEELFMMVHNMSTMAESGIEIIKKILKIR